MKKLVLTAVILAAPLSLFAQLNDNTIYGDDDRLDLYQVKSEKVLKLADSTVALFQGGQVSVSDKDATLATNHYGRSMNLCKEERFWDQQNGAFCSGSLVAPDIIMTAGHCVTSQDSCTGTKFVFGFSIKTEGADVTKVPAQDVYSCATLLGREQEGRGADWALVKLDRPVTGHSPLKLSKAAIDNGAPVFVIGHPAGLPTKVAGGAKVRDNSNAGFFVANLDTYGGNSGSAVFNAQSGLVEGILVRGEQDYVWKDSCRVSNVCPADGCRGEDVTKISAVQFPRSEDGVAGAPAPARAAPIGKKLSALLEKATSAEFDNIR